MDKELLKRHSLERLEHILERYEMPAIAFEPRDVPKLRSQSQLGGDPMLPPKYKWPESHGRHLDFVLQVDMSDTAPLDPGSVLPSSGLLTFFYDTEEQPWGFDPKELDGFRVEFVTGPDLERTSAPGDCETLPQRFLDFRRVLTVPAIGSRAYDLFDKEAQMSEDELNAYFSFSREYEEQYYSESKPRHHLLGFSANIQGDMQLEAQLVSHGLYCGDSSGYDDRRAADLKAGIDDWMLLLQLDSDEHMMWGDVGMLYFWIRSEDLAARRFDKVWMALQCF